MEEENQVEEFQNKVKGINDKAVQSVLKSGKETGDFVYTAKDYSDVEYFLTFLSEDKRLEGKELKVEYNGKIYGKEDLTIDFMKKEAERAAKEYEEKAKGKTPERTALEEKLIAATGNQEKLKQVIVELDAELSALEAQNRDASLNSNDDVER